MFISNQIDCIAVHGKADDPRGLYKNWDSDLDGKITVEEVRITFLSREKVLFYADRSQCKRQI